MSYPVTSPANSEYIGRGPTTNKSLRGNKSFVIMCKCWACSAMDQLREQTSKTCRWGLDPRLDASYPRPTYTLQQRWRRGSVVDLNMLGIVRVIGLSPLWRG
jgi:hypothetical protein